MAFISDSFQKQGHLKEKETSNVISIEFIMCVFNKKNSMANCN